jgi:thioesterase domain-containing protein
LAPGAELARTLDELDISCVTLPPSILSLMPKCALPALRTLVVAGERCSGRLASRWSAGRRLINAYGPTETTVCATTYTCPQGNQPAPPIGKPLPDCELYICDEAGAPVADGQAGELYIGGPGVAAGYLGRPELARERFVAHPASSGRAERVYRTGDLVRRRSDGNFEFIGRRDHQVKIRGVRIELDEVAKALERHPAVRQAAVVEVRAEEGPSRLLAYAVLEPHQAGTTADVRRDLMKELPEVMVPFQIVEVERMPLTANGKIDRAALSALSARETKACLHAASQSKPARDRIELLLVREWEELVGRKGVGISEDFFVDLGGDSILGMQLLARLERRWGYRLSPGQLFECPTIEQLAVRLREQSGATSWSPIVPIQPAGLRRPLYFVHPGGGNSLCYLALARCLGPDQPFFALQAPGIDGAREPLVSVPEMAAEYIRAIRQIQPRGPYCVGGWSFGGIVAYEMACQLAQQGQQVALLAIVDAGLLYSFAVVRTLFSRDNVPLFHLTKLDPDELMDSFRNVSATAQLVPPGAGDAMTRRIFDIFRLNVEAVYRYRPQPYPGSATLLLAREKFLNVRVRRGPFQEWSELCEGRVQRVWTAGNHLTLIHEPHVRDLAMHISGCLARAACEP